MINADTFDVDLSVKGCHAQAQNLPSLKYEADADLGTPRRCSSWPESLGVPPAGGLASIKAV